MRDLFKEVNDAMEENLCFKEKREIKNLII